MPASAAATSSATPDLARASAYLVSPSSLIGGHYYQSVPRFADFGLTIDGALALAAAGDQDRILRNIVAFLNGAGKDASGKTINDWTGIGTKFAAGGQIGKEALLAEVTGANPRNFGGHDLIAALDSLICAKASVNPGPGARCPAAGSFAYAESVFDQALGVLAMLRTGQAARAAGPIGYLESLRNANGSFPSLIPKSGAPEVDSTAAAVMALALAPGSRAATDVTAGLTWIAGQQERDGGFPGAGGDSVNSAALAIQALTLRAASYRRQIATARAFLAREQNSDGGFRAAASGQRGSNLRASVQAVSGMVGTPYGALSINLTADAAKDSAGCTATSGVLVVVDFGHWGGPLLRACDPSPASSYALLNHGGWQTTGTDHDGPGFICRIGYAGFRHGTQYPTPAQDPCVQTPPASAYWTSWLAGPGQDTWTYSRLGALAYRPAAGSVELWIFGGTNVTGTTGSAVPAVSPGQLRSGRGIPALTDARPMAGRAASGSGGSSKPTLITIALLAVIALAGTLSVRRRAKRR